MNFREQRLNLSVLIKLPGLFFENQIISHAAGSEFPDAFLVLAAIRMRVEVAWAIVGFFEQLNQVCRTSHCKLESNLDRAHVVAHSTAIRGSEVRGLSSVLSAVSDDGC